MLSHNPSLTNELKNWTLVLTLLALYLVLIFPYIVRVKIDQIVQVSLFNFKLNVFIALN